MSNLDAIKSFISGKLYLNKKSTLSSILSHAGTTLNSYEKPIAVYREGRYLVNIDRYSVTSSRHRSLLEKCLKDSGIVYTRFSHRVLSDFFFKYFGISSWVNRRQLRIADVCDDRIFIESEREVFVGFLYKASRKLHHYGLMEFLMSDKDDAVDIFYNPFKGYCELVGPLQVYRPNIPIKVHRKHLSDIEIKFPKFGESLILATGVFIGGELYASRVRGFMEQKNLKREIFNRNFRALRLIRMSQTAVNFYA